MLLSREKSFDRARLKEVLSKILAVLKNQKDDMLSFNEVSTVIKPQTQTYKGIQSVPVSLIVGSEGRYKDFNRRFFPKHTHLRHRWEKINDAYNKGIELPPVQLYEIGGVYFVRDGNHRVSVARMKHVAYIDAEVISMKTDISLKENKISNEDLRQVLLDYEKKWFYKKTRLDKLRPDADIAFTALGRYDEAVKHIDGHKYYMNLDKEHEIPFKDAVVSWYDNVYMPIIRIIETENILQRFPGRTPSDLYIWIVSYWDDLKRKYGNEYSTLRAVKKYSEKYGKNFWDKVKQLFLSLFRRE